MEFYRFLNMVTGFYFKPIKSMNEVFYLFKDDLLKYGFLVAVMGNISLILSRLVIDGSFVNGIGFIIGHIVITLIISFIIMFICLGVIYLIISFTDNEIDPKILAGSYLSAEFAYFILLPVAIIITVLPEFMIPIYNMVSLIIFIVVLILKIRAIRLSANISEQKSIGLVFVPLGIVMLLGVLAVIYSSMFIVNLIL